MITDFTKGKPARLILTFAVPYLIGNLFQQFYNIADTVIVGQILGVRALAAVGATGSVIWFAQGAIQSLTAGFSAVTAQKFGEGDMRGVKKSFALSCILTFIISAVMTVLCCSFAMPFLELLNTPKDIINMSYGYVIWVFAGLMATGLYNLLSNMIRALGDSKTPLYFLIVSCIVNIILDIALIVLFDMGPDGAGLATAIAQLVSGICCIVYIVKKQPMLHFYRQDLKYDKPLVSRLLKTGMPMAFLNMVISVGGIITTYVYNGLNTLAVAAYTAAAKIESFVIQPFLSIGSASAVFVAQNYGARKYRRIMKGVSYSVLIGFLWSAVATVIIFFIGKAALTLVVSNDGVTKSEYAMIVKNGYFYLLANTILTVILGPLVVYKSALQAVSRAFMPLVSGFTEIIGRAGTALALASVYGFMGVAFANPVAWLLGLIPIYTDYLIFVKGIKNTNEYMSEM